MDPMNFLLLMDDEHTRKIMGCYGHPIVKTPNIDALAASGTRFESAYTNCPICVPARASFATGRYVHEISAWDNAHPYEGEPPSWGHRLQDAGVRTTSVGKLHYRNAEVPVGFDEQIIPLHLPKGGVGDIHSAVRDEKGLPPRNNPEWMAERIGPGDSKYIAYDGQVTDLACEWIAGQAACSSPSHARIFPSSGRPSFMSSTRSKTSPCPGRTPRVVTTGIPGLGRFTNVLRTTIILTTTNVGSLSRHISPWSALWIRTSEKS